MDDKISIVTVCYNAVKIIERTILSIINQTYDNVEYIIIDGSSTDGTVDVIKKYESKVTKWVSEPDKGIFDAMNKGLSLATGEWVAFMNAGDYYVSDSIIKEVFSNSAIGKYAVIYGDMYAKYPNASIHVVAQPFYNRKRKFVAMGFSHQSVFVKTKYAKSLKFDLGYKVAADYNMIHKIHEKGCLFYYYPDMISAITVDGFSSNNRKLQLHEVARITGCKNKFLIEIQVLLYLLKYKMIQFKNWLR